MLARLLARLGYHPRCSHYLQIDDLLRENGDLRKKLAEADALILRMQVRDAPSGSILVRGHFRKAKVQAGHFSANARLDDAE